jgi:hypothetical protein
MKVKQIKKLMLMFTLIILGTIYYIKTTSIEFFCLQGGRASSRVHGYIVAFLKSVVLAQNIFQRNCIIDQNFNRQGEFGTIMELAGLQQCRKSNVINNPVYLSPAMLEEIAYHLPAANQVNGTIIKRGGYHLRLYLPGVPSNKRDHQLARTILDLCGMAFSVWQNWHL